MCMCAPCSTCISFCTHIRIKIIQLEVLSLSLCRFLALYKGFVPKILRLGPGMFRPDTPIHSIGQERIRTEVGALQCKLKLQISLPEISVVPCSLLFLKPC